MPLESSLLEKQKQISQYLDYLNNEKAQLMLINSVSNEVEQLKSVWWLNDNQKAEVWKNFRIILNEAQAIQEEILSLRSSIDKIEIAKYDVEFDGKIDKTLLIDLFGNKTKDSALLYKEWETKNNDSRINKFKQEIENLSIAIEKEKKDFEKYQINLMQLEKMEKSELIVKSIEELKLKLKDKKLTTENLILQKNDKTLLINQVDIMKHKAGALSNQAKIIEFNLNKLNKNEKVVNKKDLVTILNIETEYYQEKIRKLQKIAHRKHQYLISEVTGLKNDLKDIIEKKYQDAVVLKAQLDDNQKILFALEDLHNQKAILTINHNKNLALLEKEQKQLEDEINETCQQEIKLEKENDVYIKDYLLTQKQLKDNKDEYKKNAEKTGLAKLFSNIEKNKRKINQKSRKKEMLEEPISQHKKNIELLTEIRNSKEQALKDKNFEIEQTKLRFREQTQVINNETARLTIKSKNFQDNANFEAVDLETLSIEKAKDFIKQLQKYLAENKSESLLIGHETLTDQLINGNSEVEVCTNNQEEESQASIIHDVTSPLLADSANDSSIYSLPPYSENNLQLYPSLSKEIKELETEAAHLKKIEVWAAQSANTFS